MELTPGLIESTFRPIEYVTMIGDVQLNYSLGKSVMLALQDWVWPEEIIKTLARYKNDTVFGDVNVRFCT